MILRTGLVALSSSIILSLAGAATLGCGDDAASADADDASGADASDTRDAADDGDDDTREGETSDATPEVEGPVSCDALGLDVLRLRQDGVTLRDALGRAVHLRGVNAGGRAKFAPYVPFAFAPSDPSAPPFDEALAAYYDRIAAWGLDVVRLPFVWEAIEPTRGTYDEAFLAQLDAMIAAARARRIRVVLDNHQDVFARPHCGDGFPLWALADPAAARPADCSSWFLGYFENEAMQADFDRFWNNEDGLRDAFEAMWTMLAERYADDDAVIGFEIINEPGWGSGDANVFSRDVLTPFYTRMIEVVRAVAPDTLVFFEPTGVDGVVGRTLLERPVGSGLVFAPHYYDPIAIAGGANPDPDDARAVLARWHAVGAGWDVPVFVGEFGLPAETVGARPFLRAHWDTFEALGMHGTQWEYSVTGDVWNAEAMSVVNRDGSEREVAAELVRAYPIAVAGELEAWTFDHDTREGRIVLDADGVTLIAAPKRLYPDGVTLLSASGASFCTKADDVHELFVVGGRGAVDVRFGPAAR